MTKSTRQVGNKLEKFIADYLKEIDPKARPTKNSGASTQIADVLNKLHLKVECKKRNTENCIIKRKVWNKLCSELIVSNQDIPILALQNKYEETFIVLDIKDFFRIYKEYINAIS